MGFSRIESAAVHERLYWKLTAVWPQSERNNASSKAPHELPQPFSPSLADDCVEIQGALCRCDRGR